ncbi:MAG TPA: T9SS type A sorting domain-containing protein, partial [Flavitalea sp.]|nr:T9SS type A sorting domain-containing protein [Flavitalea sp.]
ADWRGNDFGLNSRRIILAVAPSNENLIYVTYENGLSQDGTNAKPEADMYRLDVTGGVNTWTNLSANMPDFPGQLDGVDPFETQDGYNLTLVIKPDDANAVFLGGSNLYRSTSGFTNTTATAWIGGYTQDFASGLKIYPNSHPDFHNLAFMPNNNNSNPGFVKAMAADDGGLQSTDNIMSVSPTINPVTWAMTPNYQTLQYYHVAIDPTPGSPIFIGGAQDNGTRVRTDAANNHFRILSGDGAAATIGGSSGTTFTFYGSSQLGQLYRDVTNTFTKITPTGLTPFPGMTDAFGEFVTYFEEDFDNPEDLYYVNFNRLFRTKNGTTVTSSTWEELTGVSSAINPSNGTSIGIRALELTRGPYNPSHVLYIGTTNGKVYRLNNPRNVLPGGAPENITPPTMNGIVSDIAVNPNNDEEILVTVSNYGTTSVYWTNNAKSSTPTWRNVEGNLPLPSFRSCMIVVKKDASNNPVTEYYVGTSIGLYSTLNVATGVTSWVREGGNVLNYAVVSSMDYRPQDNTLLIGTHGNGMYFANVGTPDFRPSQGTGVIDPVRNDKQFIKQVFPTLTNNSLTYRIGNLFSVNKMIVQITTVTGQVAYRSETGYQDGQINVQGLPRGVYVLTITSPDYKNQHVQRFVKE